MGKKGYKVMTFDESRLMPKEIESQVAELNGRLGRKVFETGNINGHLIHRPHFDAVFVAVDGTRQRVLAALSLSLSREPKKFCDVPPEYGAVAYSDPIFAKGETGLPGDQELAVMESLRKEAAKRVKRLSPGLKYMLGDLSLKVFTVTEGGRKYHE